MMVMGSRNRWCGMTGAALLWASVLAGIQSQAAAVEPPQGYIGMAHTFSSDPQSPDQNGFFNFDYGLVLDRMPTTTNGTFWSNDISFSNSESALPANHVGGAQGGYVGVQMLNNSDHIAIFSLWWAVDAKPGPGAQCVDAVEMWYNDDRPFEPAITDAAVTDPARPVAGGPFKSCRLPVKLEEGVHYRLRIFEISDATKPNDPEWWGAWLINDDTGQEQMIGQIQVPGSWGWLNKGTGGFIEQFGPMPDGCDSIPGMIATIYPAKADDGRATATVTTRVYGACDAAIRSRTSMTASDGGSSRVEIADVGAQAAPAPTPDQGQPAPAQAACDDALKDQCKMLLQDQVPWTVENTDDPGTRHWDEANLEALCQCTTDPAATVQCFQDELYNNGQNQSWKTAIDRCRAP